MRSILLAASILMFAAGAAPAGEDVMASRYGNTTIATDPDGTLTRLYYRADHSFVAKRAAWQSDGSWQITDGKLCLAYKITRPGVGDSECVSSEPHAIGDVWVHNGRYVTLVAGLHMDDDAVTTAALAAASRVGNTVVAADPDGTETRIYWRPDHTFSARRPGWQSEGTWQVKGSQLCLHYNIARPKMGSDECMASATPHKIGDVWGMDDRHVTLLQGNQ